MNDQHPLERLPGEPLKAHAALCRLADLGPSGSLRRLQDDLTGTGQAPSGQRARKSHSGQIGRWSVQYRWQTRLDAYFRRLDEQARREQEAAILDARKRAAQVARNTISALMLPGAAVARKIQQAGGNAEALAELSIGQLMKLVVMSARALPGVLKAEALALGDTTERSEMRVERADEPRESLLLKAMDEDPTIADLAIELLHRATNPNRELGSMSRTSSESE